MSLLDKLEAAKEKSALKEFKVTADHFVGTEFEAVPIIKEHKHSREDAR